MTAAPMAQSGKLAPQEAHPLFDDGVFMPLEHGDRLRMLYVCATCILAALVPVILFIGLWIWSEFSQRQQNMERHLVSRAVQLTEEINIKIAEQVSMLQAIGSLPSLERGSFETFQHSLIRMKAAMPRWKVVSLYEVKSGRLLVDTLGQSDQPSDEELIDLIRSVEQIRGPKVCTCYLYERPDDPRYGIHIFAPVYRHDEIRYVVAAVLKYETIQQMVESAVSEDYVAGILDENDHFIAHSLKGDDARGTMPSQDYRLKLRGVDAGIGTFVGRSLDDSVNMAAFSRSSLTGWGTFFVAHQSAFDPASQRPVWMLFATGVLSLVVAAVLAVILIYNMMLRRVGAERIAASGAVGNLQSQLLEKTREALEEQSRATSEREVLLRELYHRVKNNLQIIQSLLRLGSRNLDPAQREPFEAAVRRIGAMARVHNMLYNSPDFASIDFRHYLANIVTDTVEGFGVEARGIEVHMEVQSMQIPFDYAVPLAFVTIELLANAVKHAFPEGQRGTISVVARKEDGKGVLIISDDGVGIPEESSRRRTPLGLRLVTRLIEQIGGDMMAPLPGQSTYRIVFPLKN